MTVSTKTAQARIATARRVFERRWWSAVERFRTRVGALGTAGALSKADAVAELTASWGEAIDTGWKAAYQLGHAARGRVAAEAWPDNLIRNIRTQQSFASRFAAELAAGAPQQPGRMGIAQRSKLYSNALRGAFQEGAVDAGPDDEQIAWMLGVCIHCVWTPEARVTTRRGEIPIAEVVVGDEVKTHRARWRRVVETSTVRAHQTAASRTAVLLSDGDRSVGITGDHEVLTVDGWQAAEAVARGDLITLQLPHVERLSTMLKPYDFPQPHVRSVPADLRLRQAEVPPLEDLHGLPDPSAGEGVALARQRPGDGRTDSREDSGVLGEESTQVREPAAGALQLAASGWPALRALLARGREAASPCVPQSLGVGAGERSDSGRVRGPSQERGQERRLAGQPGVEDGPGPQAGAPTSTRRMGLEHREDLRHLRQAVEGSSTAAYGDRQALLLADLSRRLAVGASARIVGTLGDEQLLYDLTVEDDHSYIIEGIVVANCKDCPALAASGPYTRDGTGKLPALPTFPGAGATACKGNCGCWLQFTGGKSTKATVPAEPPFVDRALAPEGKPAPAGSTLRLPNADEKAQIRDMEARVNYARRMLATTTGADQQRWVQIRREASKQLREFQERAGVWSPPRFDVRDVVSGRDVTARDVQALTVDRGLDGRTLAKAGPERARAVVAAERDRVAPELARFPPAGSATPDLRQMLIRAGAPPELLPERLREAAAVDAVPPPPVTAVYNAVGMGAAETVEQHLAAVLLLAEDLYDLSVGPLDPDWLELVLVGGTWIAGPVAEVSRFLTAWRAVAAPALAPWRPA